MSSGDEVHRGRCSPPLEVLASPGNLPCAPTKGKTLVRGTKKGVSLTDSGPTSTAVTGKLVKAQGTFQGQAKSYPKGTFQGQDKSTSQSEIETTSTGPFQAQTKTINPVNGQSGNFVTVESRKRRKRNNSSSSFNSGYDSDRSTHSAATANPPAAQQQPKRERIPPILLDAPKNWRDISRKLNLASNGNLEVSCRGNNFRILPKTIDAFRRIQATLLQEKINFHTFALPSEKEVKVVLKGIPYTTPTDEIISELETRGFSPTSCTPITNAQKKAVNVFLISLKRTPNVKDVYNIVDMFYIKVTVDNFNPRPGIAQCYNCQRFGHSSLNCHLPPRCVKCAGNHDRTQCTKLRETAPKCANCGGEHPSSYRGCSAYAEHFNRVRGANQRRAPIQSQPASQAPPTKAPPSIPPAEKEVPMELTPEPQPSTSKATTPAIAPKSYAAAAAPKIQRPAKKATAAPPKGKMTILPRPVPAKRVPTIQVAEPVQAAPEKVAEKATPQTTEEPGCVLNLLKNVTTAGVLAWIQGIIPTVMTMTDTKSIIVTILTSLVALFMQHG